MEQILNTQKPYDVYMLTSTGNPDKVYIGYTGGGYQERFKEHLYEAVCTAKKKLEDPTFKGRWLISAINKYGADSFKTTRINSYATAEEAKAAEKLWIKQFRPKGKAWNMTDGGEGTSGYIPSEEHRAKLSEANKGEKHPMYGKKHTDEARATMSEAQKGENNPNYGKTLSAEHKAKISEANKGENNVNYKYPPELIASFPNQKAATEATGISRPGYYQIKKANPDLTWPVVAKGWPTKRTKQ
jgi:group I intron endonuclease